MEQRVTWSLEPQLNNCCSNQYRLPPGVAGYVAYKTQHAVVYELFRVTEAKATGTSARPPNTNFAQLCSALLISAPMSVLAKYHAR